jgi:phage terminase small subunit
MPIISNPRHERFAQELAKGKTADEAYEAAGYAQNRGNATRLKANESVVKRLSELQTRTAERAVVTAETLIAEAEEIRKAAFAAGVYAAAIAAVKEKGVLAGVRVEKRDNTTRHVTDISDDELAAIATGGREGASTPPVRSPLAH